MKGFRLEIFYVLVNLVIVFVFFDMVCFVNFFGNINFIVVWILWEVIVGFLLYCVRWVVFWVSFLKILLINEFIIFIVFDEILVLGCIWENRIYLIKGRLVFLVLEEMVLFYVV